MTRAGRLSLPRTDWGGPTRPPNVQTPYERHLLAAPVAQETVREFRDTGTRADWRAIERDARMSTEAPRVPWDEFLNDVLRWAQGEHFALIGPTGQGKTTMLLNLLPLHPFVTIFATKPRDATMNALAMQGYLRMDRWRGGLPADNYPRRIVWPDAMSDDAEAVQRRVFAEAFSMIYREGGWTVALDELWYINNELKLESWITRYLSQARSLGISLLMGSQRPAFIPLMVYDQSTHLMFWRDNDETNLRRLSGISFRSADLIRSVVSELDRHQVLYINTRTGNMCRTRCPDVRLPERR